jgi:hypothetical protein
MGSASRADMLGQATMVEVKWQANCLMEARPDDQFRCDRLMQKA